MLLVFRYAWHRRNSSAVCVWMYMYGYQYSSLNGLWLCPIYRSMWGRWMAKVRVRTLSSAQWIGVQCDNQYTTIYWDSSIMWLRYGRRSPADEGGCYSICHTIHSLSSSATHFSILPRPFRTPNNTHYVTVVHRPLTLTLVIHSFTVHHLSTVVCHRKGSWASFTSIREFRHLASNQSKWGSVQKLSDGNQPPPKWGSPIGAAPKRRP